MKFEFFKQSHKINDIFVCTETENMEEKKQFNGIIQSENRKLSCLAINTLHLRIETSQNALNIP